jgi:o-succinylbenzoate synthase
MRIVAIAAQTIRWSIGEARSRGVGPPTAVPAGRGSSPVGSIGGEGAARGRSERAAVLLEVRGEGGAIGLGEAAPLPGMSIDTLDQTERAIAAFCATAPFELVARAPAHADASDTRPDDFDATRAQMRLLPFEIVDRDVAHLLVTAPAAARFAIETALCDALAHDRGLSLAALFGPHPGTLALAAVVDDPAAALRGYAAGIRCFKIKLGAEDPLDRVHAIAAAVPGATLRIDANRSWPRAEVTARLAALAHLPVEYVEEPCRDMHLLLHAAPLPCRLALDESLPGLSRDQLVTALHSPALAAVIVKPTVLGGLAAARALAALARRHGVTAVASHALEGPIGTAACAELARALAGDRPAGLAAHPALAGWRIPVAQIAAGRVDAATAPGLGLGDVDLMAIVQACGTRLFHEADPT